MTFPRALTLFLNEEDISEAELLQSFQDYDNDELIGGHFFKFTEIIRNRDISPDKKTEALKIFNDYYRGIYKAEFGTYKVNGCDKFVAKLFCAKTNVEFQSLQCKIISFKKINNTGSEKKAVSHLVQPSKEGLFSSKNRCKAAFYTSAAIGVAALTVGYITARVR